MEFKARYSATTPKQSDVKPAAKASQSKHSRLPRVKLSKRTIFILSIILNIVLLGALGWLLTHGTQPVTFGVSGANVSNVRFYVVDKDQNVKYQDSFSPSDSINMTFGFNIDPANPQTYHVIMTKDTDTQIFNFEMPLTGAGDRKFVLPRQGTQYATGSYKVEIRDDQNRMAASNEFTVK